LQFQVSNPSLRHSAVRPVTLCFPAQHAVAQM